MVEVLAAGQVPASSAESPVETPVESAGARSPLALLRGKREAIKAKLYLDLAIPRWEVDGRQLWVRYGPGSPSVLAESMNRRKDAWVRGMPDWQIRANADVLVKACKAIYDLPIGEKPPEGDLPILDDPYPTFGSEEMSVAVGSPHNAAETCVGTYFTEADLLIATNQLLEWSGAVSAKANDDFLDS